MRLIGHFAQSFRLPNRGSIQLAMSDEKTSGIYGKPNFRLIVGLFATGIVVLLVAAWLFLRFDPLHMRTPRPATGMTWLYQAR